jgi:hypothetical protein
MMEVVRCGGMETVHLALDYFDASINRGRSVGHRRALDAEGAPHRVLEPRKRLLEGGGVGRLHDAPRPAGGGEDSALGAVWTNTAPTRRYRRTANG